MAEDPFRTAGEPVEAALADPHADPRPDKRANRGMCGRCAGSSRNVPGTGRPGSMPVGVPIRLDYWSRTPWMLTCYGRYLDASVGTA